MRISGPPILRWSRLKVSSGSNGTVHPIPTHQCHIHRTICHHARRPLCPRASANAPQLEIHRGTKSQVTVKLKDLPQGVVKLDSYDDGVDDAPRYPTVIQGHRNNVQKFKNCVVLTRVGGFYEV